MNRLVLEKQLLGALMVCSGAGVDFLGLTKSNFSRDKHKIMFETICAHQWKPDFDMAIYEVAKQEMVYWSQLVNSAPHSKNCQRLAAQLRRMR